MLDEINDHNNNNPIIHDPLLLCYYYWNMRKFGKPNWRTLANAVQPINEQPINEALARKIARNHPKGIFKRHIIFAVFEIYDIKNIDILNEQNMSYCLIQAFQA